MAVTQNSYTGNGSTVLFPFTFQYLDAADVKVKINGTTQATTTYSLANATTVEMNTAPANSAVVLIYRDTDNDTKKATFYPGSAIKAEDLNNDFDQILYTVQEVDNHAMSTLGDDPMQGDLNLGSNKITNLAAPTADTHAATKAYVDTGDLAAIDNLIQVSSANNDLTKSVSSGVVTITHSVTGASSVNNSNGTVIQDLTINGRGHVTGTGSINLDERYYTETELNAGQLNNLYYTETELNAGQLDNRYYTETELGTNGVLDSRYYTETELNNGQLDGRYYTETELGTDGVLDTRYFRKSSHGTILDGASWTSSDAYIASTAAIDDRITDLVDDVGGFVPIASETNFPTANSDINNNTGTLISIKAIGTTRTPNGSGTVTIANGAGSGNTVTITGCGSTELSAGFGCIVETSGTLHTYTFHRLTPKATEITTVAGKATEIGRLGTTDAIEDLNLLGTAAVVEDLSILATADVVADMNLLATTDVVADLNTLGTSSVVADLDTCATNVTNINTAATNIAKISTVSASIGDVNAYADQYQISTSAPTARADSSSLQNGDLWFDSSSNKVMMIYDGTAGDGFSAVTPSQSVLADIANVSGQLTYAEDLGGILETLTTETGNNINTVATNINDINDFSDRYKVQASAPTSGVTDGDLWYDSTADLLKYYNGTVWKQSASSGLADVSEDATPELGGHLDCNNKNLTEVGTVSGDNLQIDFGTL